MNSMTNLSCYSINDFEPGFGRVKIRYPEIDLTRCKFIGWGAGAQFEKFYPQLDIKLDYTVCIHAGINRNNDGAEKCGVPIYHPDRLKTEDPGQVLILVFSKMWFECMRQLADYGDFKVMRAVDECENLQGTQYNLNQIFHSAPSPMPIGNPSIGIVVQGAVRPHITPIVLAANRKHFPFAKLILSTWDDTPTALLQECLPYVDEIVTSPVPNTRGVYNCLLQRDSTLAGLGVLDQNHVQYAFKTRTDQSIRGNCNLRRLLKLVRLPINGYKSTQRERIAFCGDGSWRFVPFHLTDQLQFGLVADLWQYWQCPNAALLNIQPFLPSVPASELPFCTVEATLTRNYLQRLGIDFDISLGSYWQIFADRFTLLPENEFNFLNWKALALFDVQKELGNLKIDDVSAMSLMTGWKYDDWYALITDRKALSLVARKVQKLNYKVVDLMTEKPFFEIS